MFRISRYDIFQLDKYTNLSGFWSELPLTDWGWVRGNLPLRVNVYLFLSCDKSNSWEGVLKPFRTLSGHQFIVNFTLVTLYNAMVSYWALIRLVIWLKWITLINGLEWFVEFRGLIFHLSICRDGLLIAACNKNILGHIELSHRTRLFIVCILLIVWGVAKFTVHCCRGFRLFISAMHIKIFSFISQVAYVLYLHRIRLPRKLFTQRNILKKGLQIHLFLWNLNVFLKLGIYVM